MIPGVSRSGASIVAAMLLGADKRAAAEFSFFLAIPTMVGAFAYDFYKNRGRHDDRSPRHHRDRIRGVVHHRDDRGEDVSDYVTRHGFTLFAWWRVIVGTLGLIALAMGSSQTATASPAALRALCALKLPGGAEAPEILRRDRFQRIRRDAEALQRAGRRLSPRPTPHCPTAAARPDPASVSAAPARTAGTAPAASPARTAAKPACAGAR